ncbi:hypothetical protein GCM10009733_040900 [Nonomuraea maheshkhaliensis]|uniref:Phosphatase PAP2 family protein n=1 Tax=Nonomuraea maheshkhaliensis TaxID=419590 RepID=A0ABN2FCZ6_9ACTN
MPTPSLSGPFARAAFRGAPSDTGDAVGGTGLRLARAVVFATVCGGVSAGGHALAGGGAVPFGAYLAGTLAAFALAYLIDGRERGLAAVLAATVGTQLVLHLFFERLAPARTHLPAPFGPQPDPGHLLHGTSPSGHPSFSMALAHLTVAALTAWWLHRGERALWTMIRLCGTECPVVGPLVGSLVRLLVPAPAPDGAETAGRDGRPMTYGAAACSGRAVPRTISRRGPPATARH